MIKTTIFLVTILIVLLNISGGLAGDLYCNPSSTQDDTGCGSTSDTACKSLKAVLVNVKVGDVIHLAAGIYSGPDNVGLTLAKANVQILGDDANNCIIDLGDSPVFITVTVPGVLFAKLTIRNGIVADVNLGAISVKLNVGLSLLATINFQSVNFLNIQGTALLLADASLLGSNANANLNLNANVFVQVVLQACTFINITTNSALHVVGKISVHLNNVGFQNCGDQSDANTLVGVAIKGETGCVFVWAGLTINNCKGVSLVDLATSASLTVSGLLSLKANVCLQSLLNLNAKLNLNILGTQLSVNLNGNTSPIDCTNCDCEIVNIANICLDACPDKSLQNFFW